MLSSKIWLRYSQEKKVYWKKNGQLSIKSILFRLSEDSLAILCGVDHGPEQERLPAASEADGLDPGAARLCPRHEATQQEPTGCSALPQEETGVHLQPAVWNQQTGKETLVWVLLSMSVHFEALPRSLCADWSQKSEREKLVMEKSHLDQLKQKTSHSVATLCQRVCIEANLQPEQLQVLAKYSSSECPLSSFFPHLDALLSQPSSSLSLSNTSSEESPHSV